MGGGFFLCLQMANNQIKKLEDARKIYISIKKQVIEQQADTSDIIAASLAVERATTELLIARALEFAYETAEHDIALGASKTTIDELFHQFMLLPSDL